jgi:hypothetical protein
VFDILTLLHDYLHTKVCVASIVTVLFDLLGDQGSEHKPSHQDFYRWEKLLSIDSTDNTIETTLPHMLVIKSTKENLHYQGFVGSSLPSSSYMVRVCHLVHTSHFYTTTYMLLAFAPFLLCFRSATSAYVLMEVLECGSSPRILGVCCNRSVSTLRHPRTRYHL